VGGVHLRAPPGPVRDYWLERVKQLSKQDPIRKIPANIPEGRLLGGIDLGATLQHGKPIAETGMLGECDGLIVIAAMAERLPRNTVHHSVHRPRPRRYHGGTRRHRGRPLRRALHSSPVMRAQKKNAPTQPSSIGLGSHLDMTTLGIHDVDDEIFRRRDIKACW
jgi:hypothetical protein